jgi:hypothetical protein
MVANGPAMKAAHSAIRKPESIPTDQSLSNASRKTNSISPRRFPMRFSALVMRKLLKDMQGLNSILGDDREIRDRETPWTSPPISTRKFSGLAP